MNCQRIDWIRKEGRDTEKNQEIKHLLLILHLPVFVLLQHNWLLKVTLICHYPLKLEINLFHLLENQILAPFKCVKHATTRINMSI